MATFNEMVNEVKTNLQGYTLKQDRLTYLNAAITSVSTSMVVGSASNLAKGTIEIDDELIWIDNFSTASNTLNVAPGFGRGYQGILPQAASPDGRHAAERRRTAADAGRAAEPAA